MEVDSGGFDLEAMPLVEPLALFVATLSHYADLSCAALMEVRERSADQCAAVTVAPVVLAHSYESDRPVAIWGDVARDIAGGRTAFRRHQHAVGPAPTTAFDPGLIERVTDRSGEMRVVVETSIVMAATRDGA